MAAPTQTSQCKYSVADPDIAGVGVLTAFLASAFLTLIVTIIAFIMGIIPSELTNEIDRQMFRFKHCSSDWDQPFQKGILSISDQHIVTGVSILLAGFAQINSITVYHWNTIVYLGWMSSNIHLTTLTVLRGRMQANRTVRTIRVVGMTVLFTLLLSALIPTMSNDFTISMYADPCSDYTFSSVTDLWKAEYLQNTDSVSILSLVLLVTSYAWKLGALFKISSHSSRYWLQERPAGFLKSVIYRLRIRRRSWQHRRPFIYKLTFWPYSQVIGLYMAGMVTYELLVSFIASIWLLCVVLAWGTMNLLVTRNHSNYEDERHWTFGQLVPVLMLILPLMAIFQEISKVSAQHQNNRNNGLQQLQTSPSRQGDTDIEQLNNSANQASSNLEPAVVGPSVSLEPSGSLIPRSPSRYSNHPGQQQDSISRPSLTDPSHVARLTLGDPASDFQLDRATLYTSRFFKFLSWTVFISATGAVVSMLILQGLVFSYFGATDAVVFYYYLCLVLVTVAILLILVLAIGAPFSRISRL